MLNKRKTVMQRLCEALTVTLIDGLKKENMSNPRKLPDKECYNVFDYDSINSHFFGQNIFIIDENRV